MASGSQNGVSRVNTHPEYHLRDGNVAFLVENTLFRVHRHFFERESPFFVEQFTRGPQERISDTTAFRLDTVTSDEFAKLLWVWYSPTYRREDKPKDHWIVILDLSTRWQFPEMKKLAVDELQKLKNDQIDPVEKIVIYDKYQVDRSLLLPEYKLLCKRVNRLSTDEGERLKMPTVLGLHEVRERAITKAAESGCRSPTSADAGDGVLEELLHEVFNLNITITNGQHANLQGQLPSAPIINTAGQRANGSANGSANGNTNGSSASGSARETERRGRR